MECMEAALKPSLRREMAVSEQNVAGDDGWFAGLDSGATAVAGEDFSVDDLLDFSNGELDGWEEEEKDSVSISSTEGAEDDSNSNSGSFSCSGSSDDSESILAGGGLAVPVDDMAELEWVSRFFDDSLSESPLLYPTAIWKGENDVSKIRFEPVFLKPPGFPSAVPVKSRSKRPRTGRLSASSKSSEASSTSSCSTWSSSSIECLLTTPSRPEGKPKKKARRAVQTGPQVLFQRQCSHCGVHRTPQWRTGPTGAKTLCNACGVRYKSGRLFPEYRPACSPTFSVEIHSNSHRKVLEMRRKKELTSGGGEIMAPTVRDFGK